MVDSLPICFCSNKNLPVFTSVYISTALSSCTFRQVYVDSMPSANKAITGTIDAIYGASIGYSELKLEDAEGCSHQFYLFIDIGTHHPEEVITISSISCLENHRVRAKHIEVETKWLAFCGRYFQMHFITWKLHFDSYFHEVCFLDMVYHK